QQQRQHLTSEQNDQQSIQTSTDSPSDPMPSKTSSLQSNNASMTGTEDPPTQEKSCGFNTCPTNERCYQHHAINASTPRIEPRHAHAYTASIRNEAACVA
ncbi:MAG TPA: hypothetical protein ACQGQX_03080, partial [Xylella taiwanensis]